MLRLLFFQPLGVAKMGMARFPLVFLALVLAGCGGGGSASSGSGGTNGGAPLGAGTGTGGTTGGGDSAPPPPPPPPPPQVSVALSSENPVIKVAEGDPQGASFTFVAKVANNPAGASPKVTFDDSIFIAKPEIDSSVAGQYTITLRTRADLSASVPSGQIGFSLCEDAACSKTYAKSQQSLSYTLNFRLLDWMTTQRNASHTGYVPITLYPSRFKQLWSWWLPASGWLNAPVTGEGKVFTTSDNYTGKNGLYAFDESSGTLLWSLQADNVDRLDPPAYANGHIFVHAVEHNNSYLTYWIWMVKASTGELVRKIPMNVGQTVMAPTPQGDTVFTNTAIWGGGVSAYNIQDGTLRWESREDYRYFTSPAATEQNVFYYSGQSLTVYKRSGERIMTIQDAAGATNYNSSDYIAVPALGSKGNVITLSGTQFSGYGGTSPASGISRPIVNLGWAGPNPGTIWLSQDGYLTQPAIADGVIYAGTGALYAVTGYTARLDALDEATGKVLWSWTAPNGDWSFYRNIVVTKNLLFISSDKYVYALDRKTHQPVWQAPFPGALALFGDGKLAITTGGKFSDGRVTVFQLQ
ncbi:MAG TPA: PQQ-binding-like beta-propeller repeat protein [Pseudoduganella sp.]